MKENEEEENGEGESVSWWKEVVKEKREGVSKTLERKNIRRGKMRKTG